MFIELETESGPAVFTVDNICYIGYDQPNGESCFLTTCDGRIFYVLDSYSEIKNLLKEVSHVATK